jgi:hypothetical protein
MQPLFTEVQSQSPIATGLFGANTSNTQLATS